MSEFKFAGESTSTNANPVPPQSVALFDNSRAGIGTVAAIVCDSEPTVSVCKIDRVAEHPEAYILSSYNEEIFMISDLVYVITGVCWRYEFDTSLRRERPERNQAERCQEQAG
jgi:hypothetical protein